MDHLGGPSVVTRVLISGTRTQKGQNQRDGSGRGAHTMGAGLEDGGRAVS